MTDHIDATVVDEPGTDLAVTPEHAPPPANLFRTDDPVEVVEKAGRVAAALKSVLTAQNMVQNIQGKEHVKVEGWQTLGSMLGVVPVVTWTREVEDGWEARVEARTLDGRVVGAAEAMCTRAERMWKTRDPYALRSMAQTRATSKALRGPLGFVVTLAGYSATPAEEMPADGGYGDRVRDVERVGGSDIPSDPPMTAEQYERLKEAEKAAGWPLAEIDAKMTELGVPAGGSVQDRVGYLSGGQCDALTVWLSGMAA